MRTLIKSFAALFTAGMLWAVVWLVATLNGWIPFKEKLDSDPFFSQTVETIRQTNKGNLALILLKNGQISEKYFASISNSVDDQTIFPVASMSKWITAYGVMLLSERNLLKLDDPIENYLTRWHLPTGDYPSDSVTVRQLLSHTAGLEDGLGFGDYPLNETIPNLETSLTHPRASSGKQVEIKVTKEPGSEFIYSGGGYLILELLVEEVTGLSFSEYIQTAILDPLQMHRSTYKIETQQNISASLNVDGTPATQYHYASAAATGFAASATDLVRLVQAQLPVRFRPDSIKAEEPKLVSNKGLQQLRSPQASLFGAPIWGLGNILYAPTSSGDFIFGHDGQNDPAINAAVRINPDNGDAIIVLTSGNTSLATEIGSEWVFQQTGKPDALNFARTLRSSLPILYAGLLGILVVFLFLARYLSRSSNQLRT